MDLLFASAQGSGNGLQCDGWVVAMERTSAADVEHAGLHKAAKGEPAVPSNQASGCRPVPSLSAGKMNADAAWNPAEASADEVGNPKPRPSTILLTSILK